MPAFNPQSEIRNQQFLRRQHPAQRSFEFEQLTLHVEAAAVAAECAVRGDHAMAGDDNRDWIAIIGHAHGAKRIALSDCPGNVGIGTRLAVWNRQQRVPAG